MGHNLKPGNELYLLKIFLVFKLIESSIATLSYCFFLVRKLYKYGLYIMHYILEVSRSQTLSGIYLVLTYIERWSRLSFLSVFAGQ